MTLRSFFSLIKEDLFPYSRFQKTVVVFFHSFSKKHFFLSYFSKFQNEKKALVVSDKNLGVAIIYLFFLCVCVLGRRQDLKKKPDSQRMVTESGVQHP